MTIDPFTLAVLQNALIGIAHEMKLMTMRTAYTQLWKEQGDLSCCIMDAHGEIVAQDPTGFPIHVTTMPFQLQGLLSHFGNDVNPGDLLMTNDPYLGGTHHAHPAPLPSMQTTHNKHPTLRSMPTGLESEQEQEANALSR